MNNQRSGPWRARVKRASLAVLLLVAADPTRLRPGSGLATPVRISPDRPGKLVTKATPLSAPLPGPKRSFFPGSVAYDGRNNDCLAAYMIYDYIGSPAILEIWGVIY